MVAVVVIVDSLAAVKNSVCVCVSERVIAGTCLCALTKEHADQHNSVSVPRLASQTPGTLCTIKTSQLQLLATALPPPPYTLFTVSPSFPLCPI